MAMKAGLGVLCATFLMASPAFAAVTITNQDSKPHTIVVNYGNKSEQKTVDAGKSIEVDCPQDCGLRDLAFGTSRTAGPNAKMVVDKDAELHFVKGEGDFQMKNGTN